MQHKLYYKGSGDKAELHMHSEDHAVLKHLSNAEAATPTAENKAAVKAAKKHFTTKVEPVENKLRSLQKGYSGLRDKDGKKLKKKQEAKLAEIDAQDALHDKAFKSLAAFFEKIRFEDEQEPTTITTNVKNDKDGEGRPLSVEANPLTWNAGNTSGSKPHQDPVGWDRDTSDERTDIYIRGHLLNDNLHGPGKAWNMVPLTKTVNTTMEKQAESKGKLVLSNKAAIMSYKTTVREYYDTSGHEEDRFFPKKIEVEWAELRKGGKKDGDFDPKGQEVNDGRKSFTQGRPAMPYNINDLGETLLQKKLGLSPKFAAAVNTLRKEESFASPGEFYARIDVYFESRTDQQSVKTAGLKQTRALIASTAMVIE